MRHFTEPHVWTVIPTGGRRGTCPKRSRDNPRTRTPADQRRGRCPPLLKRVQGPGSNLTQTGTSTDCSQMEQKAAHSQVPGTAAASRWKGALLTPGRTPMAADRQSWLAHHVPPASPRPPHPEAQAQVLLTVSLAGAQCQRPVVHASPLPSSGETTAVGGAHTEGRAPQPPRPARTRLHLSV